MLVLIEDLGMLFPNKNSKQKTRFGIYKCECGIKFKANTSSVSRGNTKSCGCYVKRRIIQLNTTHGLSNNPIYSVWNDMIKRTTNPKNKDFSSYGGRGIVICERWLDIANFIEDMYPTYEDGLTIDRINNDGNYEYNNCRWTTMTVQHRNTRRIRSTNTSGYKGACWHKGHNKWVAQIRVNRKVKYLGHFNTAIEAAIAYDTYVIDNKLEHTINGVSSLPLLETS